MPKKQHDEAVLDFVRRCIECAKYDNGRCETYNRQMDNEAMYHKEPTCDTYVRKQKKDEA